MSTAGLPSTLRIQVRTGWKVLAAWVVALGATMLGTTTAISDLYSTPAKIDSYARAVGSARALEAINGHVYGIGTLGGIVANEFGFIASFAVPLMGISLIARATRRDEESGRLETLLAGRIGRSAPLVAAVLVTTVALVLTCSALAAGLVAAGVESSDALIYAAALGALGLVFAGVAAVCAQLVEHSRGVYTISLGVLVLAYLLRGAGAVLNNPLTWLSPLGWAQQARAFGDSRVWPVLLSLGVAVALIGVAIVLNTLRDIPGAPLSRGGGAPAASALLRSRLGFAVRLHQGAVLGWTLGAVVVSGAFGALAQASIEALAENEALRQVLGGGDSAGVSGFLSMTVLLLALLCGAYVIQAVGTLRSEESAGRLEPALSAPVRRSTWLGVHALVILAGLVLVALLGGLALGSATAFSTGDSARFGRLCAAVASYLPALLVLAGVALALFGTRARLFALSWLVFAFTAVVALLGEVLSLPEWLMSLTPLHHVGYPPQDPAEALALVALGIVAAVLFVAGFVGFSRREVPHG